jgi:CheY-like chemotaxis protein
VRPFHVLLLERHRDLRGALVEGLALGGYVVTPAPSVAAALVLLRSFASPQMPEVVVLDAADDDEVLRELRRDADRYGEVGVVAMRSPGGPSPGPGLIHALVGRPFSLAGLERAVRQALVRKGHLDAWQRDGEGDPAR